MTMVMYVTLKKGILRKSGLEFKCCSEQPKKLFWKFFKVVFFYIFSISYSYSENLEILQQHLSSLSPSSYMPIQSCKSVQQ